MESVDIAYASGLLLLDSQNVNWEVVDVADVLSRPSAPPPHPPRNEYSHLPQCPHLQPQKQHCRAAARQNQTHQPHQFPLPLPLLQPQTPP